MNDKSKSTRRSALTSMAALAAIAHFEAPSACKVVEGSNQPQRLVCNPGKDALIRNFPSSTGRVNGSPPR